LDNIFITKFWQLYLTNWYNIFWLVLKYTEMKK